MRGIVLGLFCRTKSSRGNFVLNKMWFATVPLARRAILQVDGPETTIAVDTVWKVLGVSMMTFGAGGLCLVSVNSRSNSSRILTMVFGLGLAFTNSALTSCFFGAEPQDPAAEQIVASIDDLQSSLVRSNSPGALLLASDAGLGRDMIGGPTELMLGLPAVTCTVTVHAYHCKQQENTDRLLKRLTVKLNGSESRQKLTKLKHFYFFGVEDRIPEAQEAAANLKGLKWSSIIVMGDDDKVMFEELVDKNVYLLTLLKKTEVVSSQQQVCKRQFQHDPSVRILCSRTFVELKPIPEEKAEGEAATAPGGLWVYNHNIRK